MRSGVLEHRQVGRWRPFWLFPLAWISHRHFGDEIPRTKSQHVELQHRQEWRCWPAQYSMPCMALARAATVCACSI